MTESPRRRNQTVSVLQASMDSPSLARLAGLTHDSSERLKAVMPLVPTQLQGAITAGPIDGATWCLLVNNSAAAAKMRQILPSLTAHLRSKGWEVESIRLTVRKSRGH